MHDLELFGTWITNTMITLWEAIGSWGVIGFGIIVMLLLPRLIRLLKKLFSIH